MILLRTFTDPSAAALAKTILDAAEIPCELTDENVHLGIAIRLLVDEERVVEARGVLDSDADTGSKGVES